MLPIYNKKYQITHYFNYSRWMFAPYVLALINKYNIPKQSCILDLGCGTGFFSRLFRDVGMKVVGIDLSEVGISVARASCPDEIDFIVGDAARKLPFKEESFDLIFCRGFSPYNLEEFSTHIELTTYLLRYLRKKGLSIFACSTDGSGLRGGGRKRLIGKIGSSWINQTPSDIKQHFSTIDSTRFLDLYFLSRLELVCFGRYGLNSFFNPVTSILTKITGIRGEVICVLEKQGITNHHNLYDKRQTRPKIRDS